MLQRIQTVWFLLAAICAGLSTKLAFYSGNKLDIVTKVKAFATLNAGSDTILSLIVGFLVAASLIGIFSFKNRKKQLQIAAVSALVAIINIILFSITITTTCRC